VNDFRFRRPSDPRWRPYKLSTFKRLDLTGEQVLRELARIGFRDIRQLFDEQDGLRPVRDLSDDVAASVCAVEIDELFEGSGKDRKQMGWTKKVKLWDKVQALHFK
jgi:phage terminase small subunit